MDLLPEWIPNIHPILVHFPVAILIVAFLLDIFSLIFPRDWWSHRTTTVLYLIGLLSAVIAYLSGRSAVDTVWVVTEAQSNLTAHAGWALWTVAFFTVYTIIRLVVSWRNKDSLPGRYLFLATAFLGMFLLYQTGEHGARLVFGYGVGTGNLVDLSSPTIPDTVQATQDSTGSLPPDTAGAVNIDEEGNWTWEMGAGAVSDLIDGFRWLEGSIQDLQPRAVPDNEAGFALELTVSEQVNSFVASGVFRDVQVDLYLQMEEFAGEISLFHHTEDMDGYTYMSLTRTGDIELGRVIHDEKQLMDNTSTVFSGPLFLRLVADGSHIRGYMNRELVVHGHGSPLPAGPIGLRLVGTGKVLIRGMSIIPLDR